MQSLSIEQLGRKEHKQLFSTTAELEGLPGFGQERAVHALRLGMSTKAKGYNIIAAGEPGTGRTSTAIRIAQQELQKIPPPPDYAYVHNFGAGAMGGRKPRLLCLPAGLGKQLSGDVDSMLEQAQEELGAAFSGRSFETEKMEIVRRYQEHRDALVREATQEAQKLGFGSKATNTGIYFMPLIDGEPLSDEAYEQLSEDEKEDIDRTSNTLSHNTADILRALKDYESKVRADVSGLEYSTAVFTLGRIFAPLFKKYAAHADVLGQLCSMREDILANLPAFISLDTEEEDLAAVLPWYPKRGLAELLDKYRINIVADNSQKTCPDVLVDYNPTVARLLGELEYETEYGNLVTDFAKIRPGLLHKANGGCLILRLADVLQHSWDALRRVLLSGQLLPEPPSTTAPAYGLNPDPIPLELKIVLVGTSYLYEVAREYLEDFAELFGVYAHFDYEMPHDRHHITETARFITQNAIRNQVLHMDYGAVLELCTQSSRMADSQDKLSTNMGKLGELHAEADNYARAEGAPIIDAYHVKKAISNQEFRQSLYESKLEEMMRRRIIMIDTQGAKIGQVNALAVLETGGYLFGKPTRITATTYAGRAGIINIEKEAELSGPAHDKGVLVLSGYLGQTYAQDFVLSLSARVAFEQTYSGVDGDSASAAELFALLSSLSRLPLSQSIAVTGSLNQQGEVQAVGGITHKVEGFFKLCNSQGLTGAQGVAIPAANVSDLVLRHEILEAIRQGMFHIYPLKHIDEGLELLLGKPAGTPDPTTGRYPAGTVHALVQKRLRAFAKAFQ